MIKSISHRKSRPSGQSVLAEVYALKSISNTQEGSNSILHTATLIENAALGLAGEVPRGLVTTLLLCANDLERYAENCLAQES